GVPVKVPRQLLEGQHVFHALQARALNRQDHDELDVARCAGDLDREAVLYVAQQPHVTVVQVPSADGAVVVAGAVPDEVEKPHREAILPPRPSMQVHPLGPTTAPCTVPAGSTIRSPDPSGISRSCRVNVIDPATQYRTLS